MNNSKPLGFTLIELLVVISIIGVLASVIVGSLADARAAARDAKRKGDLYQLRTALLLWAIDHNSDHLMQDSGCGAGAGGDGYGWLDGAYSGNRSIEQCLIDGGYLTGPLRDPRGGAGGSGNVFRYMKFDCGTTAYLMANLESSPSPAADTLSCSAYDTLYGMDYFLEITDL